MAEALYALYGLSLQSTLALPCRRVARHGRRRVRLQIGEPARFDRARAGAPRASRRPTWFHHWRTADGSDYLRWEGLFEFLVSPDGRGIAYQPLARATREALTTYLLGQVLSFSLLAFGEEPLHGTVVVAGGKAAAFIGDCGYGKSTLGAAFLRRGHALLTDDLVALVRAGRGYAVHPGMSRIKLFPGVARRVLHRARGAPMNPGTAKLIIPLAAAAMAQRPVLLGRIYVLSPGRRTVRRVAVEPLAPGRALVEIVRNTFNPVVLDSARLARQFAFASDVASRVPVSRLRYPRSLARLDEVCTAVLEDLSG